MKEDLSRIEERAEQLVESHERLLQELHRLRKKNRLSQETVGERMGVSQPAVASLENHDANPTLSTIRRYALAVGARIEYRVIDDLEVIATSEAGARRAEAWLAQAPSMTSVLFLQNNVSTSAQ
jgi:transcriptional regulator with XRE-family HTH domain